MNPAIEATLRLCYVDGNWAYFTDLPLSEQWGDDWNDAKYEHNAGRPYESHHRRNDDDGAVEEIFAHIVKVGFDGSLERPCDIGNTSNSPFSVQDINRGVVPWLSTHDRGVCIFAGVSIAGFTELVQSAGGSVYRVVEKELST